MRPKASALRILSAEIDEDLHALQRLDSALQKFSVGLSEATWDDAGLWASAGALHGVYNALENSFLRISDAFDYEIDRSARWLAELLQRMFLNVPDLRSAVLPATTRRLMKELLGFRHLYRHGYDLELNAVKLQELVDLWRAGREEVLTALDAFRLEALREAALQDA